MPYTVFCVVSSQVLLDNDWCKVYCCLPIDLDAEGLPENDTRYLSLVLVPTGTSTSAVIDHNKARGAHAAKWLDVMTQRSW